MNMLLLFTGFLLPYLASCHSLNELASRREIISTREAKVSYAECDISGPERIDCGYYGIQEEECASRGCCWQPSDVQGTNWCYHSTKHAVETCLAVTEKEDCGYYGIHSEECTLGGCCWMPTEEHQAPWCFYSAGPEPGSCGVPAIMPSVDTRIVGGETATPHSWPWQISLQVGGSHWCGGSLINNRWIVSAAHCAPGSYYDTDDVMIALGAHNKDIDEPSQVKIPVEAQFLYPGYDPYVYDQDIMLFKLSEDVEFTDEISPVCLPPKGMELESGLIVETSGWGTLELYGETPSELQQLTMNVYSNAECEEKGTEYAAPITDNMICAGYMSAGKASCHGDSGGPLVKLVDGKWTLFGAVSWGHPCAQENHPTLYTKVINYLDWIDETIAANS